MIDKLDKSSHNRGKEIYVHVRILLLRNISQQSELSKVEQVAGVSTLLEKIRKFAPRIVCFVGLGIADIVKSELALVSSLKMSDECAKYKNPAKTSGKWCKI